MSKVEMCYIFTKKNGKEQEKECWSTDLLRSGHNFLGHAVHMGQKFSFSKRKGLRVSKDAEFDVDFKNINLPE
jgi:hypothetical protein